MESLGTRYIGSRVEEGKREERIKEWKGNGDEDS